MRIAIVAPPWATVPPATYGGTEAVLDTLARGLAGAGHDVLLYATGDSTCAVPTAHSFDHALGIGSGAVTGVIRQAVDAYERVADFDIVHDHTLVGPLYAHRFPGLPVVTTNHGPFSGDLASLYRGVSERVPVIAISHDQASRARDVNVAAVIHHGLDLDRYPSGRGQGGYAVFLGRMSPTKGVDTAIRLARAAGLPLVVAAKMREPAEHDYFDARVRPLLGPDVDYIGEVGGADKAHLLQDAVCLLNPIAWPEPFGMVMIEALACGTPVIASRQGAAPEIVDDGITGFVRGDEEALTRALARVDDIDRRACRAAAEQRFSARRMVDDHVAAYERVIAATRRPLRVAASRAG